ncbi:hypothetical protein, partial [Dermacoccus nishinomiyaensis]
MHHPTHMRAPLPFDPFIINQPIP